MFWSVLAQMCNACWNWNIIIAETDNNDVPNQVAVWNQDLNAVSFLLEYTQWKGQYENDVQEIWYDKFSFLQRQFLA